MPPTRSCSPAAPGRPTRSTRAGATTPSSPAPDADRGGRRRARRAARARLAEPRRARRAAGRLRAARRTACSSSCSRRAGRCGWSRRRARRERLGPVRRARRRRPLAGRPPRRRGSRRGPGAGRSAPPARSRSARTRSTTMARELEEEWSVAPERLTVEALVRLPSGLVLLVGHGVAARRRRGRARRRARRATPGGRPTSSAWPDEADEPLRRMADAARRDARPASPPRSRPVTFRRLEVAVVHALGGLPGAARLRVRRSGQPQPRDVRARPGATGCCGSAMSLRLHRRRAARGSSRSGSRSRSRCSAGSGPFAGTLGFVVRAHAAARTPASR